MKLSIRLFILLLIVILIATGCNSESDSNSSKKKTIKLVAYESFPMKDTSLNEALKLFTKKTGIEVKLINAGDTGTMLSKAILTAGTPEGDVMWGIDNTFLSHAVEKKVFDAYKAKNISGIEQQFTNLVSKGEATPVDYGDVCVNYDINWFNEHQIDPPKTFDDLIEPKYKGLLAVQDPASSSPGLAFFLGTIAHFGEDGWKKYWSALRNNDVKVSESWDNAYYELFSGSSGNGKYPLVVSYATSPPAEVIFSDPPVEKATTATIEQTCFRQVEFAGILRGTKNKKEAQKLIDFLISKEFQKEIALNLFVYPIVKSVSLPEEFLKYSQVPENSLTLKPKSISSNREQWVEAWTQIVIP